jgi:TetR/AcrR family transcriptional regulator
MKPVRTKRKLGKHSNEESQKTKNKITVSALEIFARDGFNKASLRDIAELAGTTHNLIRHHFGSKDDLWKAVVEYGIQIHAGLLNQIIANTESSDPIHLLKLFIKTYISIVAKNNELSKIIISSYNNTRENLDFLLKKQKVLLDIIYPFFKQAQMKGYFKGYDNESFTIYLRALIETPFITSYMANKLMKLDIHSEKGIVLHTKRVMDFLFKKDE